MEVTLSADLENFIQDKVESGMYLDASDVVRDALRRLIEHDETTIDIMAYDAIKQANEEKFPAKMVSRLIEGENPLKVHREYRGMTQQQLAETAGASIDDIAKIENGEVGNILTSLSKLCDALSIDMEDLIC